MWNNKSSFAWPYVWLLKDCAMILSSMVFSQLQVSLLLLIADWMVHFIWNRKLDPDNIAIPFLTALGDLLGTGLLSLGFLVMWLLGDRDEDVGEWETLFLTLSFYIPHTVGSTWLVGRISSHIDHHLIHSLICSELWMGSDSQTGSLGSGSETIP